MKDIDKVRLQRLYTEDGKTFRKPETQAIHLAIDEFKLHDGYKFATHIIDLDMVCCLPSSASASWMSPSGVEKLILRN